MDCKFLASLMLGVAALAPLQSAQATASASPLHVFPLYGVLGDLQ
jgi:hypothetical protein